jgi:hypothetical protein
MLKLIGSSAAKCWIETAGVANGVDAWRDFKSITFSHEADWGMTRPIIWWRSVLNVTKEPTMGLLDTKLLESRAQKAHIWRSQEGKRVQVVPQRHRK